MYAKKHGWDGADDEFPAERPTPREAAQCIVWQRSSCSRPCLFRLWPRLKRLRPGAVASNDKPYLTGAGGGVAVGGAWTWNWRSPRRVTTFDQHRFVPFITGYVSDRVTVSAEIEFEHGGNPDADGEVKLEYAVIDFRFSEAFNFRRRDPAPSAFNVLHDSPLNDLTARPVVTRQIIPSTLSEAGMGFFGTTYPR